MITRHSLPSILIVGGLFTIAAVVLGVSVGSTTVSFATALEVMLDHLLPGDLDTSAQADAIVWGIRMPRVLVALLAGAILGVAGTVLQGALRNPLADSQLVGLSAAASVGALSGYWIGYASSGSTVAILLGAAAGAVGAQAVWWLARRVGGEPTRFILVGIGMGLGLAALVATASIAIHDPRIPDVTFWFFGGLGAANWTVVAVVGFFAVVTVGGLFPFARMLDVLSLGHNAASHVGLNVGRVSAGALAFVGLGVGATVGAIGVVGFVGLVAGRVAFSTVGPQHRLAIPASAFTGAIFVALADTIGRVGGRGFEVPIGLITTVLGGAYLVYLITTRRLAV